MVGAGLLASNAVERGLTVAPTVKTSLAPGIRAVTGYLDARPALTPPRASCGFDLVGYGCTTCIGNSGPLDAPIAQAIEENDLVVAAVLSGNRNFEGRIHPLVRASYLASPAAGRGLRAGRPGRHRPDHRAARRRAATGGRSTWPTSGRPPRRSARPSAAAVSPELFRESYATVFEGDERWRALPVPEGDRYAWDPSLDLRRSCRPSSSGLTREPAPGRATSSARACWRVLGDSVTTDHISPAGSIPAWSARRPVAAWSTAWRRATSTATARGAATTR